MCTEKIRNEEFWEELILFIYVAKRNCTIGCPHQVNTAKAEAEMAYQLQASKVNARIKEEEMQVRFSFDGNFEFWQTKVKVVEREQQIAIQQQEIQRKEKELNSKVWKDITGSDFWTERWGKILKGQVFYIKRVPLPDPCSGGGREISFGKDCRGREEQDRAGSWSWGHLSHQSCRCLLSLWITPTKS